MGFQEPGKNVGVGRTGRKVTGVSSQSREHGKTQSITSKGVGEVLIPEAKQKICSRERAGLSEPETVARVDVITQG